MQKEIPIELPMWWPLSRLFSTESFALTAYRFLYERNFVKLRQGSGKVRQGKASKGKDGER